MQSGETGAKLAELIKAAILDLELTNTEYEAIMALVHEDHIIDKQEQNLLKQLNEMISNGTIKKVPG